MRIFDHNEGRQLTEVTLFLTPVEMAELSDTASGLAGHPSQHHAHVSDEGYRREIVLAVYTPDNLDQFDSVSRDVISQVDE